MTQPHQAAAALSMAGLLFLPALAFSATAEGWPLVVSDGSFLAAKAEATKLQPACANELRQGTEGEACKAYRRSADHALSLLEMRNDWCIEKLRLRSPAPRVCLEDANAPDPVAATLTAVGWPEVEALGRARDPEHWARVDVERTKFTH